MLILYPIFKTYLEALQKLNFGPDMFVVKITDSHDSLEFINPGKNIIKIIGSGKTHSPGLPASNQLNSHQTLFYDSLFRYQQVPVLHSYANGPVEFLGFYTLRSETIKLSDSGYRYFEFTLQRYNLSNTT